jgi:hypothetical protein
LPSSVLAVSEEHGRRGSWFEVRGSRGGTRFGDPTHVMRASMDGGTPDAKE